MLTNYVTKKMTGAAGDFAVKYVTQNVLGKTFAGRLATSGMAQGSMMANPYAAAAMMAMDTKVGKKAIKAVEGVKDIKLKVTGHYMDEDINDTIKKI